MQRLAVDRGGSPADARVGVSESRPQAAEVMREEWERVTRRRADDPFRRQVELSFRMMLEVRVSPVGTCSRKHEGGFPPSPPLHHGEESVWTAA